VATFLYRLGRLAFRRRRLVLMLWIVVLAAVGIDAMSSTGKTSDSFTLPGHPVPESHRPAGEGAPPGVRRRRRTRPPRRVHRQIPHRPHPHQDRRPRPRPGRDLRPRHRTRTPRLNRPAPCSPARPPEADLPRRRSGHHRTRNGTVGTNRQTPKRSSRSCLPALTPLFPWGVVWHCSHVSVRQDDRSGLRSATKRGAGWLGCTGGAVVVAGGWSDTTGGSRWIAWPERKRTSAQPSSCLMGWESCSVQPCSPYRLTIPAKSSANARNAMTLARARAVVAATVPFPTCPREPRT
jgi:hypothetical protein